MKFLAICLVALTLACGGTPSPEKEAAPVKGAAASVENPIVVQFIVDGIDLNSVKTAVAAGAKTTASLLEQGVTAEHFLCTSPAPRLELPDGSRPWGGSTSSNVALHTGCHVFESRKMDDIFLSARRAGIVSVFAGGSKNYVIFDSADHLYYGDISDEEVIQRGLQHFTNDGARLLRLHLQQMRSQWTGPSDTTNPQSAYIQYYVNTVDPLLTKLIDAFKTAGVWERTYIILGTDHGLGQTSRADHPQSTLSSWVGFAAFYGPGVKRGATIPYAEGPDIAIMTNHFLGLPPLQGHLEDTVPAAIRKPTGTFLANILEGGPADVEHPKLIQRFLDGGMPGDAYGEYRERMLKLLAP